MPNRPALLMGVLDTIVAADAQTGALPVAQEVDLVSSDALLCPQQALELFCSLAV
jgi:hypothetical protein